MAEVDCCRRCSEPSENRRTLRLLFSMVVLLAACLPQVTSPQELLVGADRLLEEPYRSWLEGQRVGLITNQTGVDSSLRATSQLLEALPGTELVALFAPEHGLSGSAPAGEPVPAGPQFFSLYGSVRAPTAQMLQGVDVLVYDIQDVGVRFYTFISTLFETMQVASKHRLPLVVLDRPNPIGGHRVEGPVLESGFESFVGIFSIPVRYGLTVGELAQLLNQEGGLGAKLRVVPLSGWKRNKWLDADSAIWIAPSPNIPSLETAAIYPGFCWIEGTNLSEGRGTTRPFQLFGAPWLDSSTLVERLNDHGLSGTWFRSQQFRPTTSKYSGQNCQGVQVHILNREAFDPLRAVLRVLSEIRRLHPDHFEFLPQGFDRLVGNSWVRQMLEQGADPESIVARWQPELELFKELREQYLLY